MGMHLVHGHTRIIDEYVRERNFSAAATYLLGIRKYLVFLPVYTRLVEYMLQKPRKSEAPIPTDLCDEVIPPLIHRCLENRDTESALPAVALLSLKKQELWGAMVKEVVLQNIDRVEGPIPHD